MNPNNIQEKLNNLNKVNFRARVYKVNKGKNFQHSYFATIKREEINKLVMNEKDAVLLEISNQFFPTRLRKLKTTKNRFMLGFTVPFNVGKSLSLKKDLKFKLLSKSKILRDTTTIQGNINLENTLPSKTIRNHNFHIFDIKDDLLIWIYSKGNKLCMLPKSIPINKNNYNIYEFAGAFFCEGFKSRKENKHRDRFSFSNADPEQIEFFLKASENLLNISKKEWNVQILHPDPEESLIKFWSKLSLTKDKIRLIRNKTVKSQYGVCILSIYSSALAESFHHIMGYLEKESLKYKEKALHFFRGLSRGDIGVSWKDGSIKFSTESKENALFFRKLCNILEIPTNKIYHNKKGITGYWGSNISISKDTLKKIIMLDAISHSKRKKSLLKISKDRKMVL